MHAIIGNNLWKIGHKEFAKKDVVAIRAEALRRIEKKYLVCGCILRGITEDKELGSVQFADDLKYMPSWQGYV